MASADTRAIEGEIDRIRSLGLEELRREWRRLNHGEPPRISRDLLVLALGYRLQEVAHGGLRKSTRRKLQTMAKALQTTGRVGRGSTRTTSFRGLDDLIANDTRNNQGVTDPRARPPPGTRQEQLFPA